MVAAHPVHKPYISNYEYKIMAKKGNRRSSKKMKRLEQPQDESEACYLNKGQLALLVVVGLLIVYNQVQLMALA